MQASLDRHFSIRHLPVTRWMEVGSGGQSLVDDPSIRKPGFDVSRSHWALLNCFQTNQGHCAYCRKKSGLAAIDMCPCGRCQMRSHIVNSCPQTKLEGGLQRLHSADDVDTEWLKMYCLYMHSATITWPNRWVFRWDLNWLNFWQIGWIWTNWSKQMVHSNFFSWMVHSSFYSWMLL